MGGQRRICWLAAVMLVLTGCNSERAMSPALAASTLAPQLQKYLTAGQAFPRGIEDQFLAIDKRTGAFGGMYADSSGTIIVHVTRSDRRDQVVAEVNQMILTRGSGVRATQELRHAAARFRFSELVAYQELAAASLAGSGIVLSSDADERSNRVRLGIADLSKSGEVLDRLEAAGAPREAFSLVQGSIATNATTLRDKFRPTGSGIQIKVGTYSGYVCTLGYNVTSPATGYRYLLTASHCLGDWTGTTGGSVYQHLVSSTYKVGQITDNPAWNVSNMNCDTIASCRFSDAMLVKYSLSASQTPSRIIGPCGWSLDPAVAGTIVYASFCGNVEQVVDTGYVYPYSGMPVHKVGRTSGWTGGYVIQTCEHVTSGEVISGILHLQRTLCSSRVSAFADEADSGSPVFLNGNGLGQRVPVGILFAITKDPDNNPSTGAREYVFSPRHLIEFELGTLVF